MNGLRTLFDWLVADPSRNLRLVFTGTALGVAGVLLVYGTGRLIPASLKQELLALAGLGLTGAGVLITFRGYLGLLLARLNIHDSQATRTSGHSRPSDGRHKP